MSHIDANATMPPFSEREGCTEGATKFEGFNPVVGFDHNLMNFGWDDKTGNEIPRLIVGAAKLDVGFKYEPEKRNDLGVVAKVTNTKAGHRFPTDSPLRHLILVVEVTDQQKTPLIQTNEGKIPNWGGIGIEPNGMKNYGGKPGKIFANLLVEEDTNISPTAAYWNPTKLAQVDSENKITSDTRLWPDQADESTYYFSIPTEGDVIISVKLIYRYAFIDLAYNKGWVRPDIVVASMECEGPPTQPENMVCKTTVP